MTISKTPLQRLVTIAIGADGAVTHAWQQTTFVVTEDGVEISRGTSAQENIEPADLAAVVPQADLLRQITDRDAAIAGLNRQIEALSAAQRELSARNAAAAAALAGPASASA